MFSPLAFKENKHEGILGGYDNQNGYKAESHDYAFEGLTLKRGVVMPWKRKSLKRLFLERILWNDAFRANATEVISFRTNTSEANCDR